MMTTLLLSINYFDTGTELGGMHARIDEELPEEGLIEPAGEDHLDEEEVDYYEDEAALTRSTYFDKILTLQNMYDESSWKTKKGRWNNKN